MISLCTIEFEYRFIYYIDFFFSSMFEGLAAKVLYFRAYDNCCQLYIELIGKLTPFAQKLP